MRIRGKDPATGKGVAVTLHGDRIVEMQTATALESDPWISAGLVDMQLNGFGGLDLNDGSCDAARVIALCNAVVRTGTTTFLPTLITAGQARMLAAVRAIREACEADARTAQVVAGIHLEGPFISPEDGYRGAHPAAFVRAPSLDEVLELHGASGERIRVVTLSPHWEQAPGFVRAITDRGILCAIGHTHATHEQITAAIDAGAQMSTHLGNALPLALPRHSNSVWPQLADDRLSASFIADGVHLPPYVLESMLRAKGIARSVLVSDAVAFAGMTPGTYRAAIGNEVVVSGDGSVRMLDSGLLAGSGISLASAVARCATLTRSSLAEALQMATRHPARLLQLERGELKTGARADLLTFHYQPGDSALSLEQVIVQGKTILP